MLRRNPLFGYGKTNSIVSKVELCVVFSDENVAKNPQGSRQIHSHEARQAKTKKVIDTKKMELTMN